MPLASLALLGATLYTFCEQESKTKPTANSWTSPYLFGQSLTAPATNDGSTRKKLSIHAVRGPRATMEDRWYVSDDLRFFAVYDGHGGHRVAEQAQRCLYDEFVKQIDEIANAEPEKAANEDGDVSEKTGTPILSKDDPKVVGEALTKSFDAVSRKILSTTYLDLEGSTAVVVYMCDNAIVTANLGDSRAILCRGHKAIPLTVDHKPDSTKERKRIEDLGGRVKWHGYLGPDKLPVPGMGAYRINGNLAVSRALGDRLERPYVSSEPEIATFPRHPDQDKFIVLASDGLWDVMTSQDVVDFIKQIMAGSMSAGGQTNSSRQKSAATTFIPSSTGKKGDAIRSEMDKKRDNMAQFIAEEALRRGSADNITVIVVWLR